MADFSALVNELKQNNQAEAQRDSNRIQQAQAHHATQNMMFSKLTETFAGKSEETKNALDGVADATKKTQLTPTQQKEKDQAQQSLFATLGQKFDGMKKSFTGFFKGMSDKLSGTGMSLLKNFALGMFIIGVLKFLQSPMFDTLLDKAQEMFKYFDEFGGKLKAFIEDPSFSTFADMFSASGPIIAALVGLMVILNPLKTLTFLTGTIRRFVGLFTKGGAVDEGIKEATNKVNKRGLFGKRGRLTRGFARLTGSVSRFGNRMNNAGNSFMRGMRSPFKTLRAGASALYNGINSMGANLRNAASRAGGKANTGFKTLFKGGGKLVGGLGKAALGALKFAGPVGLVASAGMAIFDGVSAGIDEFKKGGSVGDVVREGFSGAVSGLTFGLVSQETISKGLTSIGDNVSKGFNAVKDFYVDGYSKIGDGISKVVNDPEGAFNAVSGKLSELTGIDLPDFEESKKAVTDLGKRIGGSLSSLSDSIAEKYEGLKKGVGGFFSSIFGGDDEKAKASIESDVVKLKDQEISTLEDKIIQAEARFDKIKNLLSGEVSSLKTKRELEKLGISSKYTLGRRQEGQEELAELREQIAMMNKQLEQAQSGGSATVVNAPSISNNSSSSSTVAPIYVDNSSAPAGVGAGT